MAAQSVHIPARGPASCIPYLKLLDLSSICMTMQFAESEYPNNRNLHFNSPDACIIR